MPKLPDIDSLGARPTPNPNIRVQDYSGASKALEGLANAGAGIGEDLQRAGAQIQQKTDTYDSAQAKAYVARESVDAATMFDKDNDYQTFEARYTERMKKAAQEAEKMIGNPAQRALFGMETEVDFASGLNQVKRQAQAKEKDVLRASMTDNLNLNLDAILKAPDETQRVSLINRSKELIKQARGRNAIDAEEEVSQWETFRKTLAQRSYTDRIAKDPGAVVKELAPVPLTPEVRQAAEGIIQTAAAKHGADPEVMTKIMMIESKGNPDAVSPTGAKGLYQFTGKTANQYGLTDPFNPQDSADKAAQLAVDNTKVLTQKLGRSPTGPEVYLAHQQGAAGASALLANPDKNAMQVLEAIGADPKSILNNGGTTEMTAGEFAQKWQTAYDRIEVPSHVYAPTNTTADILSPDERFKTYKAAAEDVITNAMATDPLKVPGLLAQPEYQAAFNATEREALKAKARTQFAGLEENARTDRIMQKFARNQETVDAFTAGNLTNSRLTQLQASGEVDDEVAAYLRQSMATQRPKRTTEEKAAAYADLTNRFMDFGVKGTGLKAKATNAEAEELLTFQRDVSKQLAHGFIDEGEAQTFMKNVNVPLTKKVGSVQPGMWETVFGGNPNAYQKGFRSIDTWFDASGQKDFKEGKTEVMRRYALALNEVPEDQRDMQAPAILRAAQSSFIKSQFPVLEMMDELPNAVIKVDAQRVETAPQSNAKPDATVTADWVIGKDKNGNWARRFKSGEFEALSEQQAKLLMSKGR